MITVETIRKWIGLSPDAWAALGALNRANTLQEWMGLVSGLSENDRISLRPWTEKASELFAAKELAA